MHEFLGAISSTEKKKKFKRDNCFSNQNSLYEETP
jgi:hypothetical protein